MIEHDLTEDDAVATALRRAREEREAKDPRLVDVRAKLVGFQVERLVRIGNTSLAGLAFVGVDGRIVTLWVDVAYGIGWVNQVNGADVLELSEILSVEFLEWDTSRVTKHCMLLLRTSRGCPSIEAGFHLTTWNGLTPGARAVFRCNHLREMPRDAEPWGLR